MGFFPLEPHIEQTINYGLAFKKLGLGRARMYSLGGLCYGCRMEKLNFLLLNIIAPLLWEIEMEINMKSKLYKLLYSPPVIRDF